VDCALVAALFIGKFLHTRGCKTDTTTRLTPSAGALELPRLHSIGDAFGAPVEQSNRSPLHQGSITMNLFKSILVAASLFASTFAFAGTPVNVNSADAATLAESLDGIGDSKAKAIVDYRQKNGPFKSADELVNVKGIGLATVQKNRDFIRLADGSAAKPAAAK
jgi:competence protein ComEA